jgi:hypothetical protein
MNRPKLPITFIAALASVLILGAGTRAQDTGTGTLFFSYVDGLRLRDTPQVNGKVLGVLPRGLLVPLVELEEKPAVVNGIRNRWIKVKHGSIEGWAFGGYLVWYRPRDGEKIPRVMSIEKTSIPVIEWPSLKNAVVLAEPRKGILYLDASDEVPIYRSQPRAIIPLEKSIARKSGLKVDFSNSKTVFFNHLKYHHPGEYGATGYFLFAHPDHGKVWVADCHTHQVADTLKWKDTIAVLGTTHPLWEGDRTRYRLMIWNLAEKKFVFGTLPFPKVAYSYARARFLFNNEKDGALHIQIEARNETQEIGPSDDMTLANPFYSIHAVVTESKILEITRYGMSVK